MHSLRSLSLHNNLLTYLPREILSLVHLHELSLRGNPLVVRFVKEMTYDPPSLLELAGRTIKSRNIPYYPCDLPANLLRYLDLASKCPNPKCAGKILVCDIWNGEKQAWFDRVGPHWSGLLFNRRLLWLMRSPHQIRGLLWEISTAAHALPVLPAVQLTLQLQPTERRRVGGREQRAGIPPPEGASGIAPQGADWSNCLLGRDEPGWARLERSRKLILWLYVTHTMWNFLVHL